MWCPRADQPQGSEDRQQKDRDDRSGRLEGRSADRQRGSTAPLLQQDSNLRLTDYETPNFPAYPGYWKAVLRGEVNCLERESPRARSIFVRLSTDEGRRG
jgi:hypothetical protein